MKRNENTRDRRFEMAIQNLELMKMAGLSHHPYFRFRWKCGLSPLNNGRPAAVIQGNLHNMLIGRALARYLAPPPPPRLPRVSPERAILLGHEVGTNRPVLIDRNILTQNMLIVGAPGTGKSRLMYSIVDQVMRQNKRIR